MGDEGDAASPGPVAFGEVADAAAPLRPALRNLDPPVAPTRQEEHMKFTRAVKAGIKRAVECRDGEDNDADDDAEDAVEAGNLGWTGEPLRHTLSSAL